MANLKKSLLRILGPLSICVVLGSLNAQTAARDSSNAFLERIHKTVSTFTAEGQAALDSASWIDPTNSQIWQQKSMPYLKTGDFMSWRKFINKAVDNAPEKYLAYRGFCAMIFVKDYESALLDFEKRQKLSPKEAIHEMDHALEFWRGLCYLELGNLDSARFFMEKSLKNQLDLRTAEWAHYNDFFYLGVIYYELNDLTKAHYYIDASLKNYAQFPDAHYYKALILNKLGKSGEALEHLAQIENAWKKRYRMNEDNEIYSNYPKQIGQGEIDNLRAVLSSKN
jgi:tetratricopeptide (TPR) repeat protein